MSTVLTVGSRNAIVDVRVAAGHASIVRRRLLLLLSLLLLGRLLLLMLLLLSLLLGLLSLLLLLSRSRGRGGLVCVLLVMARLLVHPCRIRLGIELVVAVDVRGWHHPGGLGGSLAARQLLEEGRSLRDGAGKQSP